MKRQLLTFAAAAAVALCTIIACSKKDSNPEKLALNSTQMSGPDDPASSINECYARFTNTMKNKPEDYIPGDAENAFTDCVNGFIDLHNGGGTSLKPPADPVPDGQWDPFFVDPPTRPDRYRDGEQIFCSFFHLTFPLPATLSNGPSMVTLKADIITYNRIIASVLRSNPLMRAPREKVNAIIYHIENFGSQYLFLNRERFYDYAMNVVFKYNEPLAIRTQFADALQMNNDDFKLIFKESTGQIYP